MPVDTPPRSRTVARTTLSSVSMKRLKIDVAHLCEAYTGSMIGMAFLDLLGSHNDLFASEFEAMTDEEFDFPGAWLRTATDDPCSRAALLI